MVFCIHRGGLTLNPRVSVQCEILQARMLGGAAEDEQFPPDDNDFDPYNFHFHGFGQMGHGPPPSPEQHIPVPPNIDILAAMGWEQWQNQVA